MLAIVSKQHELEHINGGRKDGATPRERLEITLKYCRQYLSQRYLANEYNIAKSCIASIIKWTIRIILKNKNQPLSYFVMKYNK